MRIMLTLLAVACVVLGTFAARLAWRERTLVRDSEALRVQALAADSAAAQRDSTRVVLLSVDGDSVRVWQRRIVQVRQEVDGGLAQPSPVVWLLIGGDASVSERGVMLARAPGTVTLLASDGFAPETLTIAVRAREDSLLLDERWAADWHSRWTPFGVPLPEVVTARGARAFWNAGDGKYFSGAYSKQEWDARSGLSADFDLSTPLTADTSQLVRIGFKSGGDSAVLAGWDHRTGYGPGLAHQKWCKFQFPTGDGKTASAKYAAEGAADAAAGLVGSGAKYRLRIQIFPDGRCGVALNGRPIGMSPDAGQEPTARFYIDGSTVKTQFLVFGVTIRRGVPPGVEWPAGPPR